MQDVERKKQPAGEFSAHLITGNAKERIPEKAKRTEQNQTKQAFYSVKKLKQKAVEINRQPKKQNEKTKSKNLEL